jgi:uncharacterized membrane protein
MVYLWLKIIHIISATVLFGTGLGSAFYLWRAHLSQDISAIAFATRNVVIADWIFTTPAVIIQPLTGFAMIYLNHFPLSSIWISLSLFLYILVGAFWLPVIWLQIQLREMAKQSLLQHQPLPRLYFRYIRIWFWFGWPAFISVLIIFYLMIMKPF